MTSSNPTCDIFCRVVDNFGDIGVCWRLARQLAAEHGISVRLVVDDLHAFGRIAPAVDSDTRVQTADGVTIVHWLESIDLDQSACLVIEAFACELPESYLQRMVTACNPPVWINLEYLSAEPWVAEHHLLPSPHPTLPLCKWFFFPGFTSDTGGLIRERGVETSWSLALAQPSGPASVFVFCYPGAPLDSLLDAIEVRGEPTTITIPGHEPADKPKHWRGPQAESAAKAAPVLAFCSAGFVAQSLFDDMLRRHAVLFVRGEDSFVRAQWAAKPFVWQIYPQPGDAHRIKLDAFLDLYCRGLDAAAAEAMGKMWRAWNEADDPAMPGAWDNFMAHLPALQAHAVRWAERLAQMPDLASNLLSFYKKNAKI